MQRRPGGANSDSSTFVCQEDLSAKRSLRRLWSELDWLRIIERASQNRLLLSVFVAAGAGLLPCAPKQRSIENDLTYAFLAFGSAVGWCDSFEGARQAS